MIFTDNQNVMILLFFLQVQFNVGENMRFLVKT